MAVTVENLRTLMKLDGLEDNEIAPHLNRAIRDFKGGVFEEEIDELEAIGCKALYYVAPLLWVRISRNLNEYDGDFDTFKDAQSFQAYWLKRSNSVEVAYPDTQAPMGSFYYGAV